MHKKVGGSGGLGGGGFGGGVLAGGCHGGYEPRISYCENAKKKSGGPVGGIYCQNAKKSRGGEGSGS